MEVKKNTNHCSPLLLYLELAVSYSLLVTRDIYGHKGMESRRYIPSLHHQLFPDSFRSLNAQRYHARHKQYHIYVLHRHRASGHGGKHLPEDISTENGVHYPAPFPSPDNAIFRVAAGSYPLHFYNIHTKY